MLNESSFVFFLNFEKGYYLSTLGVLYAFTGLLIAVSKDSFRVLKYRELHFNDCGDRVAQLLHVELSSPFSQLRSKDIQQEILILNTHLLFPHDSSLCLVRLHQVTSSSISVIPFLIIIIWCLSLVPF